ncbi:MAG: class I SAM-dependent methyltransferase [Vibrionaceae bacterium]
MTIDYYNQNAQSFIDSTLHVDMQDLYEPFVALLPKNALILDAGCGCGRDSKAFLAMGFQVEAMDASKEMAKHASSYTGLKVQHQTFQEIHETNKYDAIWACASLLHVPKAELPTVMAKFSAALKHDGIWYLSFKYGNKEREKDGRAFTDMDEKTIKMLLSRQANLTLVAIWITDDARPERKEKWLNIIVKKLGTG